MRRTDRWTLTEVSPAGLRLNEDACRLSSTHPNPRDTLNPPILPLHHSTHNGSTLRTGPRRGAPLRPSRPQYTPRSRNATCSPRDMQAVRAECVAYTLKNQNAHALTLCTRMAPTRHAGLIPPAWAFPQLSWRPDPPRLARSGFVPRGSSAYRGSRRVLPLVARSRKPTLSSVPLKRE